MASGSRFSLCVAFFYLFPKFPVMACSPCSPGRSALRSARPWDLPESASLAARCFFPWHDCPALLDGRAVAQLAQLPCRSRRVPARSSAPAARPCCACGTLLVRARSSLLATACQVSASSPRVESSLMLASLFQFVMSRHYRSVASLLATIILTTSAHDCGRVHRIRQRFVVDSTVVASRVVEPVVFHILYSRWFPARFLLAGVPSRLARL
jgi:hypothetical protein